MELPCIPAQKPIINFLILLIVACGIPLPTNAEVLSVHCPLGCPGNPAENDLLFAHLYGLSNNSETKFADWVAYEVDVLNFGDTPGRKWKADPMLNKEDTLEPDDYIGANNSDLKADRGHQVPLASFAGSRYWSELNYLSNISPQHKDLNQGPWKNLEDAVRYAVGFRSSLYVITGPIYENQLISLPKADEVHRVPSAYFKVIYNIRGQSASFFMEQTTARGTNFCSKQMALSTIQSKVNFSLPALTNDISMVKQLGC